MAINFLPNDVVIEILARLPVKSLLRFRLVAKSWRDIMEKPTFIIKHHLTQVSLNNGNCVLIRAAKTHGYEFALLTEDEQGVKCTRLEPPFLKDLDKYTLEVAGPCNGIVAISDGYDDLFLWNPTTREYKALPSTSQPSSLPNKAELGFSRVGFGIDPITKDYKVVRIWNFLVTRDVCIHKAEVLNLSANSCRPKGESWKLIDDVLLSSLHQPIYKSDLVYVNGKYYWCTQPPYSCDKWVGRLYLIVWFDMGTEVFGIIELPHLCNDPFWYKLAMLKESLALVRHAYTVENKYMYEIWTMDDSDDKVLWTKYATVGPFIQLEVPIGFWKNEELVLLNSSCESQHDYTYVSFSYDIKTHVRKKILQVWFLDEVLPLATYSESLVSVGEKIDIAAYSGIYSKNCDFLLWYLFVVFLLFSLHFDIFISSLVP